MSDDDRVDRLDSRVGDHDRELAALKKLAFGLADDGTDDLFTAAAEAIDRVEAVEQRLEELDQVGDILADVGESKSTKEEKVAAIVTYADQKSSGLAGTVVKPVEIEGVCGISNRYAYDLIDDMVDGDGADGSLSEDGYPWALDASDNGAVDKDTPDKGVIVDFERLHDDPEALNKFINGSAATGAAD